MYLGRSITGVLRAVKIVRREDFERDKTFEREFEGVVRYEKVSRGHIGLVDVFHVSRNDEEGFYYYVMELADDCEAGAEDFEIENYVPRTLSSELNRRRQHTIQECVEIGYQLAEALGHLHHAGLTHRDVKPSNIIFVNGKPQLADIGLVARTGQLTFVGTEGYVPPEGPGTSSSDLYSLAMVLYEMATGKDRLEFPELPTNMELPVTMNRDEWRALNSVICRAGAPDARKRYETGGAFSAVLRAVISQEETGATGIGKYVAVATALAAILAAGGFFAWKQFQPDRDPTDNIDFAQNGNPQTEPESGNGGTDKPLVNGIDETPPSKMTASESENLAAAGAPVFEPFQFLPLPGFRHDQFGAGLGDDVVISDKDSTPVPPKTEMPETVPASPTEPPEPPKKPIARYKVVSNPRGASIWQNGKVIGRTGSFLQFEPGEVELTLKFEGYHDLVVKRDLNDGYNPTELDLEMLRDQRPSPPSNWQNSLDIVFEYEPVLGILISKLEIRPEAFTKFNLATGRPEATISKAGAAYVPEDGEMFAFCDWMTKRDQDRGFLGEDQYFAPQRSGTDGESATFFCKIDNRFGTVMINSDPRGAEIFKDGIIIGQTPKQIDRVRIGLVKFELSHPGFERTPVSAEVRTNTLETIKANLKRDASVVFDQPWENSLGMKLVPFGEIMASVYETRVSDYEVFLTSEPEGITQPRVGFKQEENHPVAGISVNDARAFCKWLTEKDREAGLIQPYHEYRLPTDLEWSAMAGIPDEKGKSPDQRDSRILDIYPWGTTWPPPAGSGNFADESAKSELSVILPDYNDTFSTTAPVGSFEPRENGLHDLSGNVWEWVEEAFRPGSKFMTARGGGWADAEKDTVLASYRNAVAPSIAKSNPYGFNVYGFRCVLAKVK